MVYGLCVYDSYMMEYIRWLYEIHSHRHVGGRCVDQINE
jgi:hypothetical protein